MLFRKLKHSPVRDKNQGYAAGVTNEVSSGSMLQSIEDSLTIILRNISEIIYILDENGHISYVSESVERVGFSPNEIVGMNIFELVHPEDRERSQYHVNERRTGERGTHGFEVRFVTRDVLHSESCSTEKETPVFTIAAEGRYGRNGGTNMHFAGTVGVAKPSGIGRGGPPVIETAALVPICAKCKNIRDRRGVWVRVEEFLAAKTGMLFTHSICHTCTQELYPDLHDPE